jgi:hypothetical protein
MTYEHCLYSRIPVFFSGLQCVGEEYKYTIRWVFNSSINSLDSQTEHEKDIIIFTSRCPLRLKNKNTRNLLFFTMPLHHWCTTSTPPIFLCVLLVLEHDVPAARNSSSGRDVFLPATGCFTCFFEESRLFYMTRRHQIKLSKDLHIAYWLFFQSPINAHISGDQCSIFPIRQIQVPSFCEDEHRLVLDGENNGDVYTGVPCTGRGIQTHQHRNKMHLSRKSAHSDTTGTEFCLNPLENFSSSSA